MLRIARASIPRAIYTSFFSTTSAVKQQPNKLTSLSDSYSLITKALLDPSNLVNKDSQPVSDALSRISRLLDYTVPLGKQFRGNAVVSTLKTMEPFLKDPLDDKLLLEAHAVGWSLELAQAALLVSDDMMDGSETRRGKPCWYKIKEIGTTAVNDVMILQNSVSRVLQHFVKDHKEYNNISSLMLDLMDKTLIGQIMDNETNGPGQEKLELSKYTLERYFNIVLYKTAYYTVNHPIRLGFYLAGFSDPEFHSDAEDVLLLMGQFFQVQDDFLDVFGDPAVTGKIGTDIQDGKCNWPVVKALEKADGKQRKTLEQHYGVKSKDSVKEVLRVYNELKIKEEYQEFERKQNELIKKRIQEFANKRKKLVWSEKSFPQNVFTDYLEKLVGRKA